MSGDVGPGLCEQRHRMFGAREVLPGVHALDFSSCSQTDVPQEL